MRAGDAGCVRAFGLDAQFAECLQSLSSWKHTCTRHRAAHGLMVSTFHIMVTRRQLSHRFNMKNGCTTVLPLALFVVALLFSLIVLVTERLCAYKRTAVKPPIFSALGRKPLPYPNFCFLSTLLPASVQLAWPLQPSTPLRYPLANTYLFMLFVMRHLLRLL